MSRRKLTLNPIAAAVALALTGISTQALATPPAAGTALGNEFKANATTANDQRAPAAASDAAGNSVVVWASSLQDGDGYGIYAQRYDASGNAAGAEFRINTTTAGDQIDPAVAMDASGNFVVVWESPDLDHNGIVARRYDASGTALSGEIIVDSNFIGNQQNPRIGMSPDGRFVIVWESNFQDGSGYAAHAKLYDAGGTAQSSEFRVNTTTVGDQKAPDVAMDGNGGFVVTWQSAAQDGAGNGVYARQYDASGTPETDEFQVNTTTAGDQQNPSIGMDVLGDFVIAWGVHDSGYGIDAQYYDASPGSPIGHGEFQVNTTTTGNPERPHVSMSALGDYTIAWQSDGTDGSGLGVYAQRYAANAGGAQGGEFKLNSTTSGEQSLVALAKDAFGDMTAVWQSAAQDGDGYGIYAQRFEGTHELNLSIDLEVDPSGVVMPGTQLTLSAHVTNGTGALTGIAALDSVLGLATGVTATIELPKDAVFLSASDASGYWNCTGPVDPSGDNTVSCSYWPALQRTSITDAVNVTVYAPFDGGGLVLFTDHVAFDNGTDIYAPNNMGATGVFLIGPIVSDASIEAHRNTAKSGTLQGADLNGNPLSYSAVSQPLHGSVTVQAGGKYSYKPATDYVGTDNFKFKATAGGGDSNVGTVQVQVTESSPSATAASFSMTRNTVHTGTLKGTDPDKGDKLTYKKASNPAHGSVTVSATGAFTYTPKANFHGQDKFKFTVSDGTVTSAAATVTITVK